MPFRGQFLAENRKVNYACAMNNPGVSQGFGHAIALQSPKGAEKNFVWFYPRNLLKSLDSGERIQGNPNKSNPQNRRF
jgi:hypothetical protein